METIGDLYKWYNGFGYYTYKRIVSEEFEIWFNKNEVKLEFRNQIYPILGWVKIN